MLDDLLSGNSMKTSNYEFSFSPIPQEIMKRLRGQYKSVDSDEKFELIHHTPKTIGLGVYSNDRYHFS